MEVIKFKADHLRAMLHEPIVKKMMSHLTEQKLLEVENYNYAFAGLDNGKVIFCAGVTEYWPGRGEAWAFLDSSSKAQFLAVHNAVKRFLRICPIKRIEATVDVEFEEGHRWVRSLGFKLEAERMRSYRMDGHDSALYARVS